MIGDVPHDVLTCFRNASRARNTRTNALFGDACFRGEVLNGCAFDIDAANRSFVIRLQRRCETGHAAADLIVHLGRRRDRIIELPREALQRPVSRARPAIVVDHRVAESAVEPQATEDDASRASSSFSSAFTNAS